MIKTKIQRRIEKIVTNGVGYHNSDYDESKENLNLLNEMYDSPEFGSRIVRQELARMEGAQALQEGDIKKYEECRQAISSLGGNLEKFVVFQTAIEGDL